MRSGARFCIFRHKVGVVFAVLVEMQVGQQNDAQVFYRLIHRDRIKRRDEALIHLQIVQQDAAQHKHDGQQPCQNFFTHLSHKSLSAFALQRRRLSRLPCIFGLLTGLCVRAAADGQPQQSADLVGVILRRVGDAPQRRRGQTRPARSWPTDCSGGRRSSLPSRCCNLPAGR